MKKIYLLVLLIYAGLMSSSGLLAQDALFSQYYANWMRSNPAMTGNYNGITVQSLFRDQWRAVQFTRSRFMTGSTNISAYSPCLRSGFGFYYTYNAEGEGNLQSNDYGFSYSYVAPITPNNSPIYSDLRFGLTVGRGSRQLSWDKLVFTGQLHPLFGIDPNQNLPQNLVNNPGIFRYTDVSSGIAYQIYNNNNDIGLRLGIAAHHINKPSASFINNNNGNVLMPWRWTAHGSFAIEGRGPNQRASWIPGFKIDWQKSATVPGLFETNPDAFTYRSINFGLMYSNLPPEYGDRKSEGFYGGLWYHNRNPYPDGINMSAFVSMVGVIFKREGVNYNVGLSGDYYFQGAGPSAGMGIELSLTVNWPYATAGVCRRVNSRRSCPPHKSKYPLPINF